MYIYGAEGELITTNGTGLHIKPIKERTQANLQLYDPVSGGVTYDSGFAADTQPTTTLTPSCTTTQINTLLPTALNDDSNCFTIDAAIASGLSSYSTTTQTDATR